MIYQVCRKVKENAKKVKKFFSAVDIKPLVSRGLSSILEARGREPRKDRKEEFNMKRRALLIVLAAVCLWLSGCAPVRTGSGEVTGDQSVSVYAGLVDLLREELEELRRDQSLAAAEYEARIRELEDRLFELSSGESDTESEPEDSVPQAELPITYTEQDGKIIITGVKSGAEILVIPSTIDGKPVVAIADNAFSGSSLVGISVPEGVESIGWFAFFGCVSLTSVSLPSSLESIGYDAFTNCPRLTLYCPAGSYAEKYAVSYGLSVVNS